MAVLKNAECEFCGKVKKWVASNTFHGFYCMDCIRLNRKEDAECLREIQESRKQEKIEIKKWL